jgi:hypothetical protein
MAPRIRVLRFAIATIGLLFAGGCQDARAEALLSPFVGAWLLETGEGGTCKRATAPEDRLDGELIVTLKTVSLFEGQCQIGGVKPARWANPGHVPITVALSCIDDERTKWRETNMWQLKKAFGQTLFVIVNTSKTIIHVFKRCSG